MSNYHPQSGETMIDFAIITAIEVERRAVCKAFGLTDKHREKREGRVYWRGRLPFKNGKSYELVVAQAPDMANLDAALLTVTTLHHWRPGAVLMVGIAAAASPEQALGDLVLGKAVYYYERGKITPHGHKPEPSMYPADATLWNNVIALPAWKAAIPVARPDASATRPTIHLGVIASGEKVIADAAVRDEIAAGHRKIVAIEMEGYGVSKAVWDSFNPVRHLVIRAICDLGDASKNSVWHSYAAAAAAGFAKHFLLDCPLEPRNLIDAQTNSQTAEVETPPSTSALDSPHGAPNVTISQSEAFIIAKQTPTLRERILEWLNEDELRNLCRDHFPQVYRQFTAGMSFDAMVLRLVDFAERKRRVARLLDILESTNPGMIGDDRAALLTQLGGAQAIRPDERPG
jgi:nucleoside phosphorylase